jgi:hypothetical protein
MMKCKLLTQFYKSTINTLYIGGKFEVYTSRDARYCSSVISTARNTIGRKSSSIGGFNSHATRVYHSSLPSPQSLSSQRKRSNLNFFALIFLKAYIHTKFPSLAIISLAEY